MTFYFENDPNKPIRAAGVLLYKVLNGCTYYLMQIVTKHKKGQLCTSYEDFGGKIEPSDSTWKDILLREAVEESNGVLNRDELEIRLQSENAKIFYHERSKYLFAVIEANPRESALQGFEFGDTEVDNGYEIKRVVKWLNANDVSFRWRTHLHIRLRIPGVFNRNHPSHRKCVSNDISNKNFSSNNMYNILSS